MVVRSVELDCVASGKASVIGPQVWVGSSSVNVLQILTELQDEVIKLAAQAAAHTHGPVPPPTNAAVMAAVGTAITASKAKLTPVVA